MNSFQNFISKLNPLGIPSGKYVLNARSFRYSMLGAILIIVGVVLKNTFEQLNKPKHPLGVGVGMAAFVLGWIIIAYATSTSGTGTTAKTLLSFACAGGIVFAVIQMKKYMKSGAKMPMIYPIMFAGFWLLLGYTVGMGWGSKWNGHTTIGVLGAVMVLLSMMITLPWQRKKGVIDGPGLPLFVGGWVLLAFGNSYL